MPVSATTLAANQSIGVARLRVVIRGAVQGVGFRPFIYRLATAAGLPGWVINSAQGVFIEVEGEHDALREFLQRIESDKPAIAHIYSLEAVYLDPVGFSQFEIRESEGGEKTALILPDIATCPDCLRELNDPADRRFHYPFTNCTNCGPRFTIIEALPYDRPRTSMKKFGMCEACSREYHDPGDRRFHAQPNACPVCGPHLELWDAAGAVIATHDNALSQCADAIKAGQIVAIKGLGGFHLMVDARNQAAVLKLRARKHREEKPFALMFPSRELVTEYCEISPVEDRLLRSPESPIVLLLARTPSSLAPAVAPRNPLLGVMLPYTPLHHLLMQELGFPVVATSGNLSEEPICTDEHDALNRLGGIADLFLVHNRPIVRHVDDSIVREMAGRELVLRRARGFAPLPVFVQEEIPSIAALGAHQKNTIAVSVGPQIFVSQHIGDLETDASFSAFQRVIEAFYRMYELHPAVSACDMHPDYVSTRYALKTAEQTISVQHHYAHVLSCMAENHLQAPVLGIAFDGSGFGMDATVWGGEFLRVTDEGFDRVAHLRTFRLPGGEKAVREPRRVALAMLYEIFGEDAFAMDLPTVRAFSTAELRVIRTMLKQGLNSPVTSSAGRLFDAVASLIGLRQTCKFEGQAAMELEFAISGDTDESYPYAIQDPGDLPLVCDWGPMVKAILREKSDAIGRISQKFHNTLGCVVADIAERIGEAKVVLTGGCFQNRYLTENCIQRLEAAGFQVYWHQRVPPNDGGISLGQVMAAAAKFKLRQRG
jgi:hydrogenase maturation protein HypF